MVESKQGKHSTLWLFNKGANLIHEGFIVMASSNPNDSQKPHLLIPSYCVCVGEIVEGHNFLCIAIPFAMHVAC